MDKTRCFGFILAFSLYGFAGDIDLNLTQHEVEFTAYVEPQIALKHFEGRCTDCLFGTYNPDTRKGSARLDLTKLHTGIGTRDEHMLQYLGTKENPLAFLKFSIDGNKFTGTLSVKGIEKPIAGMAKERPLQLEFVVNMHDFGIDPKLEAAGITLMRVKPLVRVLGEAKY